MQPFRILVQLFSLFGVFHVVTSIPTPLGIEGIEIFHCDPHSANKKDLQEAVAKANRMLSNALKLIKNPKIKNHKTFLLTAFGRNYQTHLSTIQTNIERLQSAKTHLVLWDASGNPPPHIPELADPKEVAAWLGDDQKLVILKNFYQYKHKAATRHDKARMVRFQAGVLIHEAVHAVLKTYDYFDQQTFVNEVPMFGQPSYVGYVSRDLATIRDKEGANALRFNPDSYRLFAHLATDERDAESFWDSSKWRLRSSPTQITRTEHVKKAVLNILTSGSSSKSKS